MKLVRVGLALTLLAASCVAQEKSKGYDFAACGPDDYYGVHLKQDGKDLVLDQITEEPGVVKSVEKEVRYKFQSEKDGVADYTYQSGPDVLEIKLKASVGRGMYYQNGKLNAVLFVGEDADGSKLAGFTLEHVQACADFLGIPAPSADKKDI